MWLSRTYEHEIQRGEDGHVFIESRFLFWKERCDFYPSQDRIVLVKAGPLGETRATGTFDDAVITIEGAFMGTTYVYTSATAGAIACLCMKDVRLQFAKQFGVDTAEQCAERLVVAIGRPLHIVRCC